MTSTPEQMLGLLEDTAELLKKAKINLSKCPKQRLTQGYLEARYKTIEDYWSTFETAHLALGKAIPREQRSVISYFANEEFHITEDLYLSLQADIKDMLLKFQSASRRGADVNACKETSSDWQVKLPSIQLPTFSGKYDEWPTYHDLFTTLVHNNTSISQVQKLHYLKTTVTNEAEGLLRHIQVTESNYIQAWDILRNRFGNKRLIVSSLLKRLFNQRKMSVQSASSIKSLLDTTTECINNLKNQNVSTETWDPVIIFLIVQKLDSETHKEWEQFAYKDDPEVLPSWSDMKKFLESRFRTLELITPSTYAPVVDKRTSTVTRERSFHVSTSEKTCIICKENHTLCHCKEFTKMDPEGRSTFVKNNKLCFNCLLPGHAVFKCRLRMSCRICKRRHHTLLHQEASNTDTLDQPENTLQPTVSAHTNVEEREEETAMISSHYTSRQVSALLATAMVRIKSDKGNITMLRALVDQGSQACFISEKVTQILNLKRRSVRGSVIGVGSTKTGVKHMVQLQLLPRTNSQFSLPIEAYVMPKKLTTQLPHTKITPDNWQHLEGLNLADPEYLTPGSIDILLGVREYASIVQEELIKGPPGSPCAQKTKLGWILFGDITQRNDDNSLVVMHHSVNIDDMLHVLWEINTDSENKMTKEEELCEKIYVESVTRSDEGRYIVKLPFKTETPKSPEGQTREIALKRLKQLETRLERDTNLKTEYNKVLQEYIDLNHMEEVPQEAIEKPAVYLPHHPVVKEGSETTKVRAVFNASNPGYNKVSLNDELLVGPQLQDDMRSLIMRWRLRKIAYVSDIQKMYRAILVNKEDIDYQRIMWRTNANDPVKDYRLLRVTFGIASAPYLAVKTLQQLAHDEGKMHPIAAEIIMRDYFMDDLMSGQDTVDEAIDTAKNITAILKKGGFILQKWASNSAEFLKEFPPSERSSHVKIDLEVDGIMRTLGLTWNMGEDILQYKLTLLPSPEIITKRGILSEIQKLFDPLCWLAPAIIPAKILMQSMWLRRLSWDDEVEPETKREWLEIRNSLTYLEEIHIPRWLQTTTTNMDKVTVHGYCDASTKAYGAVAYLRVEDDNGDIQTTIIAAKTRVAPIKQPSLPRLELCGAVLLSELLKQISKATRIPMSQIYAWSDSTIVLSWLQGDPGRWVTFVRNRVITVLENIGSKWFHVQSKDNPADIASRGMMLPELQQNNLWWYGPDWLKYKEIPFPNPSMTQTEEEKVTYLSANMNIEIQKNGMDLDDFSSLDELLKTIIYCIRFMNSKKQPEKIDSHFTTEEFNGALVRIIRKVQGEEYANELKQLRENKHVSTKSNIKTLNPFLDSDGVLRVGGRLRNADMDHNNKHPIILSHSNHLSKLIIKDAHLKTLHGGVQLTLGYVRSRYWIIRAKNLVKNCIHNCLICVRHSAINRKQVMGDLPQVRVTQARPFLHSGVDFAGPIHILMSKGRGMKTQKAYIAVFICMSTKAIHLELVSDLTSEAFIGAFRRFVARRGRCLHIWSDQGRNFVAANKELFDAWREASLEIPGDLASLLSSDGTQWHFIPPYSPNFGGLWEAGVKSVKSHLKKMNSAHLTFEEMMTLLCQIEACLNSRPLSPIDDDDPDNVDPLTPGHFLIGEAPVSVPNPDLTDISSHRLSRWQHIQKHLRNFWAKWQNEYLTRLQERPKWLKYEREFDIGDIVLVKEENLPPGKWALGRIVSKHPGPDGMTRVYSLKCHDKIIKRSLSKLCAFPVDKS